MQRKCRSDESNVFIRETEDVMKNAEKPSKIKCFKVIYNEED